MAEPDTSALEQLLAQRGDDLMRAAVALTGRRPEAEDLLQAALERLLRNWPKVADPEAYLRRTLYNLAADSWRRRGRPAPGGPPPSVAGPCFRGQPWRFRTP